MDSALALIGNLSLGETLVIAILAVLVFGRRLPEVAARVFRELSRLRVKLDEVRRETGIDRELREVRSTVEGVAREAERETAPLLERPPRPAARPPAARPGEPPPPDPPGG